MSIRHSIQRVARSIQSVADPAAEASAAPALAEAQEEGAQMARELIRALSGELDRYRRLLGSRDAIANPAEPLDSWSTESILNCPPESVRLGDLERLERVNPELLVNRWNEIKERARRDIATGWWAARSLEPMGGSAWRRACFLAVRQVLRDAWQPRNDGESLLLDEMAQYEMLRQEWVGILATIVQDPRLRLLSGRPCERGEEPRQVTAVQANQEAMHMIERLQRLYQNALRTLLNLRRGKSPIVRQPQQINVAVGQQLNVHSAVADPLPAVPIIEIEDNSAANAEVDVERDDLPVA